MALQIVRNDIVNMMADVIVNSANPQPVIGSGTESAIYARAGQELLEARREIGDIACGEAAATPGFALGAKYVIHTVSPFWQGGGFGEAAQLASCYSRSLALAAELGCESIAFPLLGAGNCAFPETLAMRIARRQILDFLEQADMQVFLVLFDREAYSLSETMFRDVQSFVDEAFVERKLTAEYAQPYFSAQPAMAQPRRRSRPSILPRRKKVQQADFGAPCSAPMPCEAAAQDDLSDLLKHPDAGFSETLLQLIDRTGKKDSEIYKRANVDRKLFSKIRNNPFYQPSKTTAVAFAFALELDIAQARDLIGRAGFTLTRSNKFDIVVEYFLLHRHYNVFDVNEVLFSYDLPQLGPQ